MRHELRQVADLTAEEQAELEQLSLAVYPPDSAATWPGRSIEWAKPAWCVIDWDSGGKALCYVGVHVRAARWNERPVKVGGIGGVKTHPTARGRGLASAAIRRAVDFFWDQGDVDFGLLVCEPNLVPFYERLGWRRFAGTFLVTQQKATVPFSFALPMTLAIRLQDTLTGTIDLQGPPW